MRLSRIREWVASHIVLIVGALAVSAVVLITYQPALNIGFWTDDFLFLEKAGRLALPDYLATYFDPRLEIAWYRPVQGMQWWFEYVLWRGDPFGYHLVQILYHLANSLLLYALVTRVSRNVRLGLISAVIFATLPLHSVAVYWIGVPDPLAAFFFLLTVWLWIDYLERGGWGRFILTFGAFVSALLSKEITVTLPLVLLLVDRWLVAKPASLRAVVKRNAAFFLFLPVYALLESTALTQGAYVRDSGFRIGEHLIPNLTRYLSALAFPWEVDSLIRYAALLLIFGLLIVAIFKREYRILFLGAATLLAFFPVLPFPGWTYRYLYLALVGSAVGVGLIFEFVVQAAQLHRLNMRLAPIAQLPLCIVFVLFALWNSAATADGAEGFAGSARQTRLQFRPIYQLHPTFAPGTYLYFVDQPFTTPNISGLMFLRYGANVTVSGSDYDRMAALRSHSASFVYYLDSQNVMREQLVDPNATTRLLPALPVQFAESITLDGSEVTATRVKHGEAIILILYWQAGKKIDKDYTVFAHLVDRDGNLIAGSDSQPKRGAAPTSRWKPNSMVVDPIVLPIDSDAPVGDGYRVELGMYYLPTMQRLSIVDAAGQPAGDAAILDSFSILP